MTKQLLFEVWKIDGRTRTLVARFRRPDDAKVYVRRFGIELQLEIVIRPAAQSSPRRRRLHSDVVAAKQHPDEFIADHTEPLTARK